MPIYLSSRIFLYIMPAASCLCVHPRNLFAIVAIKLSSNSLAFGRTPSPCWSRYCLTLWWPIETIKYSLILEYIGLILLIDTVVVMKNACTILMIRDIFAIAFLAWPKYLFYSVQQNNLFAVVAIKLSPNSLSFGRATFPCWFQFRPLNVRL